MVTKNKNVFLQALIVTIAVFIAGLVLGYFLEANRTDKTELAIMNSEINIMDEQVRTNNIEVFNISCELSKESTFNFANKIYNDALLLEEYDSKNKFTDDLKILHKKYDLLRIMLWMESTNIKEKCKENFHIVVYMFEYVPEEIDKKAEQSAFSRLLLDIKNKYGNEILLIPIAGNLDIESVNILKKHYKITKLPVVIIDEKVIIREMPTFEELEKTIFRNSTIISRYNNQ